MSAWSRVQQLPEEALQQIYEIYGDDFPIAVRHYLAEWIDKNLCTDVYPDNPFYDICISQAVGSFIQEIENRAASLVGPQSDLVKHTLMTAASNFKERSNGNLNDLFNMIQNCLRREMEVIYKFEQVSNNPMDCGDSSSELNTRINVIRFLTQETAETLKRFEDDWEIISGRITLIQNSMEYDYEVINAYSLDIVKKLSDRYLEVKVLLKRVIDVELTNWKRNQQLAGNGAEFETAHLDTLQMWCENLAEIVWANFIQTKEAKRLCEAVNQQLIHMPSILNALNDIERNFNKLLSTLVMSTFIIEKQPPQVLKTNSRFSVKIRLLVGEKLNLHLIRLQVKVSIISEAQTNQLLSGKVMKGDSSGEILNNIGTMEYDQSTKQLSATFGNMQLKKITRSERRGSDSVVDEKFSLYFSSNFPVGSEPNCYVWTISLPVTVIVHGNQEPQAWATITWDNAFAESGRKSLAVPEKVSWNEVSNALNMKFHSAVGKPLSVENLNFIAEKLLRVSSNDYDTFHVSWSQFCKDSLPGRNFTFWDWFYAVMKLTREHLKPLWMDGTIHGFVHKRRAEEMLSSCPGGTFLLRFSDSELGGITVAWVAAGNNGQTTVTMIQPFTAKDFLIRSLADRLNDLNHLMYLYEYPNIMKNEAFGKYYTPNVDTQVSRSSGYVKPMLKTCILGMDITDPNSSSQLGGSLQSFPNTPHSQSFPNMPNSMYGS